MEKKLATTKQVVAIEMVKPNGVNPNVLDGYKYEKMKEAIQTKGLFGSIIVCRHAVDGYFTILDGEHRWKALKELGHTEIPVEVAVDNLTENEIKFWTIYFNNTRGKDDIMKRAKLMHEIDNGMAQLLPFTEEEKENERSLHSFDFAQYEKDAAEEEQKPFQKVLAFKLTEAEYKVWQECLEVDKEKGHKRKPEAILMVMIDEWLGHRIIR